MILVLVIQEYKNATALNNMIKITITVDIDGQSIRRNPEFDTIDDALNRNWNDYVEDMVEVLADNKEVF